jgi:hypothetical protein
MRQCPPFGETERRQPCRERAVAAQITPFGRGSDGQSDDQVAAHNGGYRTSVSSRPSPGSP